MRSKAEKGNKNANRNHRSGQNCERSKMYITDNRKKKTINKTQPEHQAAAQERARLPYLDAARGLAILLVVLGHIWETEQPLPVLIYSFHVPLFFIISGILAAYTKQEQRPFGRLIAARLKSLLIPYACFELGFVVIFGIRNHFDFSSQGLRAYDGLLLQPLNVPLWFLPTLFLTELFLRLLLKRIKNRTAVAFLCAVLFVIPFFATGGLGESAAGVLSEGPVSESPGRALAELLLRCCSSLGFLAFGYFSCRFVTKKNPPVPAVLAVMALGFAAALYNGKTGIYKLTFHNPLLFTLCAVTGSYGVLFLLKKMYRKESCPAGRLLALAGRNSVAILGLHIIVLRILQQILGLHTDSIGGGLLALAGICLLLVPACLILNRFLPFVVGKRRARSR